jgi:hypothetical protein
VLGNVYPRPSNTHAAGTQGRSGKAGGGVGQEMQAAADTDAKTVWLARVGADGDALPIIERESCRSTRPRSSRGSAASLAPASDPARPPR